MYIGKVLNGTELVIFEFCSEKGCSKCVVNLLIMKFDGSVSENL